MDGKIRNNIDFQMLLLPLRVLIQKFSSLFLSFNIVSFSIFICSKVLLHQWEKYTFILPHTY